MKKDILFIVVIGCGRLGAYLANRLSGQGCSVVVIDQHQAAFDGLTVEFGGFRVEGDCTEVAVLKQAKIERADIVVATTNEDNINLMVAQIARQVFKVPRVIARVYQPERETVYRVMGIETICPTTLAGEHLLGFIRSNPSHSE